MRVTQWGRPGIEFFVGLFGFLELMLLTTTLRE